MLSSLKEEELESCSPVIQAEWDALMGARCLLLGRAARPPPLRSRPEPGSPSTEDQRRRPHLRELTIEAQTALTAQVSSLSTAERARKPKESEKTTWGAYMAAASSSGASRPRPTEHRRGVTAGMSGSSGGATVGTI
jgi:hypothetical protein